MLFEKVVTLDLKWICSIESTLLAK